MSNGEDIGGRWAHIQEMERRRGEALFMRDLIEVDRAHRLKRLAGKFVVATDGKSSKKQVFYQDPRISSKGYWTQFLSNAFGFISLEEARDKIKSLRYNNPRIYIVTSSGSLEKI